MKTNAILMLVALMLRCLTGCSGQPVVPDTSSTGILPEIPSSDTSDISSTEPETQPSDEVSTKRAVKMTVNGREILITLYDTPTANALYEALPMELSFSDYNGTEKIAYPPETLPTEGEPDGCDPDVGDLCLYAPWGNLCIFYQDFRYSVSLIKLGHVESGMDVLAGMDGDFTVTLERND